MNLWVSKSYGYTPLLSMPSGNSPKILDLNPNTTLSYLDEDSGEFMRVAYVINEVKNYVGWVNRHNVEWYVETLPKDCVSTLGIATPDTKDFEQYVIVDGVVQHNMCGEMCVAYIENVSLKELLDVWKVESLSFWKRIFGSGHARGTSDLEVAEMLSLYGVNTEILINTHKAYTPQVLKSLEGAIVSVRIDKFTGRLNGSGVPHWVVVEDVENERMGYGTVKIYNPAPNRIEIYSYKEFLASARVPYGVKHVSSYV